MSLPVMRHGIIVGVDGSPASMAAVDWAARDAAMRNISLTVVRALDPPMLLTEPTPFTFGGGMSTAPEYLQWQQDTAREILHDALKTVEEISKQVGPIDVNGELMTGHPVPILTQLSKDAEMVVVGRHGDGRGPLARGHLGSVSTGLVHHAHCPVVVIHDKDPQLEYPSKAPVVVGIDGSPASESATAIAFDEASRRGVDLVAVHAINDSDMIEMPGLDYIALEQQAYEILGERLAGWRERYPDVTVSQVVQWARPAHSVLEHSEKAQLVVVGSHGRGGFTGMLLGSVSTAVAQSAQVPVIVARRR